MSDFQSRSNSPSNFHYRRSRAARVGDEMMGARLPMEDGFHVNSQSFADYPCLTWDPVASLSLRVLLKGEAFLANCAVGNVIETC